MPTTIFLTIAGIFSLVFSASVAAHISEPGAVLPHFFTGEHLLILVVVGLCIAGLVKYYRRSR